MSAKYTVRRRLDGTPPQAEHITIIPAAQALPKTAPQPAETEEPAAAEEEVVLSKQDIKEIKTMVRYYEKTMDYMLMRSKPSRVLFLNLIGGMAKGFGIALGITVIAFFAFKILNSLQILNLPIIGDFLAELIEYIDNVQNIV